MIKISKYKTSWTWTCSLSHRRMEIYKAREADLSPYRSVNTVTWQYTSTEGNVSHDLDWRFGGTMVSNSFFINHGDASWKGRSTVMLKAPGLKTVTRGHFSAKMILTNSTGINQVQRVLSNCFLRKILSQIQWLCFRVLLSKVRPWVANTWKMGFSQTKALTNTFLSLNNYIWVRSANELPWLHLLLPSPEMQHLVM